MLFWFIIILIGTNFVPIVSFSTENATHSDKDIGTNVSHYLHHHMPVASHDIVNEDGSFYDEIYLLENSIIQDTNILMKETSLFMSNVTMINTRITVHRAINYSIFIQNTTSKSSELIIESASNVTIVNSHFITENVKDEEDPSYALKLKNVTLLVISGTYFGNEMGNDQLMQTTNLGIHMDNILFAEIRNCNFTGINSPVSNGSAMFLNGTEAKIISCDFHFNIVNCGLIYANNSVSLTTINTSFISNSATTNGAAIFAHNDIEIVNNRSKFIHNKANRAGAIYMSNRGTCINIDSLIANNSAPNGAGAFGFYQDVSVTNINCTFIQNDGDLLGGAIWGRYDIQVNNTRSRFISNRANTGGAIYLRFDSTCINIGCIFIDNIANVIGLYDHANCSNINCNFSHNAGKNTQ